MSVYKTGSVKVKVGSSEVVGSSAVSFSSTVSAGDLFKIRSEAAFYDIASVESATNLQLSTRYSNSSYNITATGEVAATANDTATAYSGSLDNTPVLQNHVVLSLDDIRLIDNGAGSLSGTNSEGTHTGSIDYDTAAWTIDLAATLSATPSGSYNITGSYIYGDTLNGMAYQIVKDFTPNYSLPELSLNDSNFQQVYTKAMRLIDSALFEINASSVSASNDITVLATPSGFCLPDNSGAYWRISVSNTGTLTTATY